MATLPIGDESKFNSSITPSASCNVVQSTCIAVAKRNRETPGIQKADGTTSHRILCQWDSPSVSRFKASP